MADYVRYDRELTNNSKEGGVGLWQYKMAVKVTLINASNSSDHGEHLYRSTFCCDCLTFGSYPALAWKLSWLHCHMAQHALNYRLSGGSSSTILQQWGVNSDHVRYSGLMTSLSLILSFASLVTRHT